MVKKKLTKSAQVRALLNIGKTTEYIVKKVGCTKTLVRQINGMREIDAEKVGGNPIPEFLQKGPLGSDTFAEWLASTRQEDTIDNPPHYKRNGIEVVDVIEAFELNYRLGNVVKYVLRHMNKGGVNDLKKAQWYLNREISKHE